MSNGLLVIDGARPVGSADATSIVIDGDRIADISPSRGGRSLAGGGRAAARDGVFRVIAAEGLVAAPGLIDLQLNGAAGHDLTEDPASVWDVAAALPRYGVTAFLPTLVSADDATIARAQDVVVAGPPAGHRGASVLGWHLEGPFLSPARAGVHPPAALRAPDDAAAAGWSTTAAVRMVTLAPELPGATDLVRQLTARGVVVAAGHSDATYAEACTGFDAGVRAVTHLFNAMRPLDHRDPGIVGAALDEARVTLGVIADGLHVDPVVVGLAWRLAGGTAGRMALVTDAIAALGMPPGRHRLAGLDITTDATSARAHGRLAGSVLSLDQAVRNLVAFTGCTLDDALGAASSVPARLLGEDDRGVLRAGAIADLVLLAPGGEVVATIVGGEVLHGLERLDTR